MNTASNTRLRLNYQSWSRSRSHWSATSPRNQHTAFRTKTHEHTQWKLARLAACATPVRPMACAGQTDGLCRSDRWPVPVRPVDRAGRVGGCSSRTTRASVTSLGPETKTSPKHNLQGRRTLHEA
jgi:hypothetical protein